MKFNFFRAKSLRFDRDRVEKFTYDILHEVFILYNVHSVCSPFTVTLSEFLYQSYYTIANSYVYLNSESDSAHLPCDMPKLSMKLALNIKY